MEYLDFYGNNYGKIFFKCIEIFINVHLYPSNFIEHAEPNVSSTEYSTTLFIRINMICNMYEKKIYPSYYIYIYNINKHYNTLP